MKQLEKNSESTNKVVAKLAKRLYKFAPVGFRIIIEQLLARGYKSDNLNPDYLQALKQYFSSFIRENASNTITPDLEEMLDWIDATLDDHQSLDIEYKFNKSKKMIYINLNKVALEEIVNIYQDSQQENLQTEEEADVKSNT